MNFQAHTFDIVAIKFWRIMRVILDILVCNNLQDYKAGFLRDG